MVLKKSTVIALASLYQLTVDAKYIQCHRDIEHYLEVEPDLTGLNTDEKKKVARAKAILQTQQAKIDYWSKPDDTTILKDSIGDEWVLKFVKQSPETAQQADEPIKNKQEVIFMKYVPTFYASKEKFEAAQTANKENIYWGKFTHTSSSETKTYADWVYKEDTFYDKDDPRSNPKYKKGDLEKKNDDGEIQIKPQYKDLCYEYVIPTPIIDWDQGTSCYVSQKAPSRASPSLRTCYAQTDSACCNYVQDEEIAGRFGNVIPGPCGGAHVDELGLFQCLACRGTPAFNWTIKAEATKEYAEKITSLMSQQQTFSQIPRSFVDHIRGLDDRVLKNLDTDPEIYRSNHEYSQNPNYSSIELSDAAFYPNGYVKVCASWLQRLWGVEVDDLEGLNKITSQFDACGGYDGDGNIVPNQRDDFAIKQWSNALDFLEWFGVQKMSGFGIIIINKEDKSQYNNEKGINTDDLEAELNCFDSALYLHMGALLISSLNVVMQLI